MNKDNYLEIPKSKRDIFIYRIMPINRLFELFHKKQNVLVKPQKWEDPFENFILRSKQIYGQCWTLQSASDAMWRIYSPESNAVRVRSKVSALAEGLYQMRGKGAQDEVFIGRVQYLPNKALMSFAKNTLRNLTTHSQKMLAKTLLVKRPAFRHEREVRLIFIPQDKILEDIFPYSVDPNLLINQIMIDPRMSLKDADTLKIKIKAETGFSGEIKRSLLYAPPPDFSIKV